jgi:hypothetical protein
MLIEQVEKLIGDGDAVVAWDAPNEQRLDLRDLWRESPDAGRL